MQHLFVFVPLALFFIAYTLRDIFVATTVLMVATCVMLLIEWLQTRTVRRTHLWITALLLVLGTVTVMLRDPVFIQWKVTIVHWLFAALLFGSQLVGKKPAIQSMMEMTLAEQAKDGNEAEALPLDDSQWRWFNAAWGIYFVFVGFINLYVAYSFPEAIWVKFKVFGILGLQLVFLIVSMAWLFRKINSGENVSDAETEVGPGRE